jgi:hypothetical protein
MEHTLCLELERSPQENRLAFLALPAKRASEQVTGTENDIFKAIQKLLTQMISDVCWKRTADEFRNTREEYFPKYFQVMRALNRLVSTVVPRPVIQRLAYESFSEMEADLREKGQAAFGKILCEQAMFTVWTLRKISDLGDKIRASQQLDESLEQNDKALVKDFVFHLVYARFHLDCLALSLNSGRAIQPEVLECVSDGLRAIVNAYAFIRQGYGLRQSDAEEEIINIEFDDEEQELLALSMRDIPNND